MKSISLLRKPDFVTGAVEGSPFRFEENSSEKCPVKYDYIVENDCAKVVVYPSGKPVKYLKLRFSGDLSTVESVFGDQWERSCIGAYLEWRSVMSSRVLPWYCYLRTGKSLACYGVKTGANAFAFWQVDPKGITLFLNLCCANHGTHLKAPICACEIVQLFSNGEESVYVTAQNFCRKMCDKPVLPKTPIFGVNNWYWAYGCITKESVLKETEQLLRMTEGCSNKPYMIIDDGWEKNRKLVQQGAYIGGPWLPNKRFKNIQAFAEKLSAMGVRPGIWFRPLLTRDKLPEEAQLTTASGGKIMDPTHPFTLEQIGMDVERIRSWGFELIKHDFSTIDFLGHSILTSEKHDYLLSADDRLPYDRTQTSATVLKNLYSVIQKAAGNAEIIGCNTVGHLCAGIHSIQRVGGDTSGRVFEWTKRDGVNSVMRLPQNETFFNVDPDCAAFTKKVDEELNLDYLELCACTGMTTIASVEPDILSKKGFKRINEIFRLADQNTMRLHIDGFENSAEPYRFVSADGKQTKEFDWWKKHKGSRVALTWYD